MRRENRISNLMKRDEVLRNHMTDSGFMAFITLMVFGCISIITDLFSKEITWNIATYSLRLLGMSFLVFAFMLFMLTKAKKEYFTKNSARIVSLVASICSGMYLYTKGVELWIFLFGWALISIVLYKCINYIFEDIYKNHPYF